MQCNEKDQQTKKGQSALLLLIVVFFWFAQYVYIPYQTPYLLELGMTASFAGIVVGAYGVTQLLCRMPVGLTADKWGKNKPLIVCGMICSGGGSLIRILFPSDAGYFIANLISGVASSMWISYIIMYTGMFAKSDMLRSTSRVVLMNNFGIFLAFLAGMLLHDKLGIRFLFILSVVSALLGAILALFLKDDRQAAFSAPPLSELTKVYKDKRLLGFSVLTLVQQGINASTANSFTSQVAKKLGADGFEIGLCSLIYIAAAVASSLYGTSKAASRHGSKLFIPMILLFLAAYCFIVPNIQALALLYPVQILVGLGQGLLLGLLTSEAMKNVPDHARSTAMGFFQAIYALGLAFFPMMMGAVQNVWNTATAYYILCGIAALSSICAVLYYRGRRCKPAHLGSAG